MTIECWVRFGMKNEASQSFNNKASIERRTIILLHCRISLFFLIATVRNITALLGQNNATKHADGIHLSKYHNIIQNYKMRSRNNLFLTFIVFDRQGCTASCKQQQQATSNKQQATSNKLELNLRAILHKNISHTTNFNHT